MCVCILPALPQFLIEPFLYFLLYLIEVEKLLTDEEIDEMWLDLLLSLFFSPNFLLSASLSILTKEYHHTGDCWTVNTHSHMYKGMIRSVVTMQELKCAEQQIILALWDHSCITEWYQFPLLNFNRFFFSVFIQRITCTLLKGDRIFNNLHEKELLAF